jgi:hypothetical protein
MKSGTDPPGPARGQYRTHAPTSAQGTEGTLRKTARSAHTEKGGGKSGQRKS